MRFPFLILAFFSLSTLAFCQSADLQLQRYDSIVGTQKSRMDRVSSRIDSLQLRSNQIINPDLSAERVISKLRAKKAGMDSSKAVVELDSIKGNFQNKIDSLKHLNLPTDKYQRKLDSVSQLSPQQYIEKAKASATSIQDRINKPIDNIENKINRPVNDVEARINEKLGVMNSEGGAAADLPSAANVGDVNLPGAQLKSDLGIKESLGEMPGLSDINSPLTNIENPVAGQFEQVGEVKDRIAGLQEIPQQQIDRIKSIDEVERIQGKAGEANALIDKAQAYQSDAAALAKGDIGELEAIPDAVENKVASLDEVKDMQKQTGEMTQYQEMLSKGNDPEAMKALAKEQATKYAVDHFAGKQEALKGAMDKMSKLKSKYAQVSSIKDLPKRVPNPMKGKPLIERIVPAFTFQIQKSATFMLDLNPSLSYRITGRLQAGAGWNERLSFTDWNKLVAQDRIFGPRVYSSFSFRKGFSLRAEVEKMNVYLPIPVGPANVERNRNWVWSAFVGFKKDYDFYKKIKGNVQVLYNIYDDHDNSPYIDRLNVRMGFEFPMKKKR